MVCRVALALVLGGCCVDASSLCEERYGAACVQAAFDSEEACGRAAADSDELGCSIEYEEYLACLENAQDCGSCEALRINLTDCSSNVCNYSARIDRGCFNNRPDCNAIFDEGRTPDRCLPFWRSYMLCLARTSPDEVDCDDQCIEIFNDFWRCD